MKYGIFTVRDNKTQFAQVWTDFNEEAAKRGFSMMLSSPDNIMGYCPSDFDLFKVGEFDSLTGQIEPVWPIEYLMNGNAAIERSTEIEK